MVNLLAGPKGSGKTKRMIELANNAVKCYNGNVVFIKKRHKETYNLSFDMRVICMDDYEEIKNIDQYGGFLYGLASANSDIEAIFIDSILKHTHIEKSDMPEFIKRLDELSRKCKIEFFVSISADKSELSGVDMSICKLLN